MNATYSTVWWTARSLLARKLDKVSEVGVNVIASCCPACKTNSLNAIAEKEYKTEVLDMAEVARARHNNLLFPTFYNFVLLIFKLMKINKTREINTTKAIAI